MAKATTKQKKNTQQQQKKKIIQSFDIIRELVISKHTEIDDFRTHCSQIFIEKRENTQAQQYCNEFSN